MYCEERSARHAREEVWFLLELEDQPSTGAQGFLGPAPACRAATGGARPQAAGVWLLAGKGWVALGMVARPGWGEALWGCPPQRPEQGCPRHPRAQQRLT